MYPLASDGYRKAAMIELTDENKTLFTLSGGFCVHCGSSRGPNLSYHCPNCWDRCKEKVGLSEICNKWDTWNKK